MPVRPIVSEMMDEEQNDRIEELERRVQELEERLEQMRLGFEVDSTGAVRFIGPTFEVLSSTVSFNTPHANFAGIVQCNMLQAITVSGASYTPGAGNIM